MANPKTNDEYFNEPHRCPFCDSDDIEGQEFDGEVVANESGVKVKVSDLSSQEREILSVAKLVGKKLCGRGWWVQIVEGAHCLGQNKGNRITIDRSRLQRQDLAIQTMLHELAHYVSQAPDVHETFEAQLSELLGRLGALYVNAPYEAKAKVKGGENG